MIFTIHRPENWLKPYIEQFIYFKDYMPEHALERVVPDGGVYLISELDGMPRAVVDNDSLEPRQTYTRAWISGIHNEYISITAKPKSEMFVVQFKPHGALPFFHCSMDRLKNSVVPAETVLSDAIFEFRDRLLKAVDDQHKIQEAEAWLETRYEKALEPDEIIFTAVERMHADPAFGQTSLQEIIQKSGVSDKHFIHLFKKFLGLTPKQFQRVLRFNELLQVVKREEEISWSAVSAACGYFDQAHFIKEFKRFCGINPKAFLEDNKSNERLNFFPLD